ncbi:MAG TPA: DinB family protein [Pyrinomonadaceae bacterium]|nr:DinB family protein [Pyrinomonadaceae bacterium]
MPEVSENFLAKARALLAEEYLPKIERCMERLTDDDVWWRAGEASNSVGNLLLHMAGNARQWIVSGVGRAPDERDRQSEFDERRAISKTELLARLKNTLDEVDRTLAGLNSSALLETRSIQGYDVTVLEAVFHVVEHFSMHTGQIILLTKMLKSGDMRFYDFSSDAPKENWKKSLESEV